MSLKYLILGTLEEKPHHGYELKQKIESNFGESWSISFGQLYPTLHRMTEQGLIDRRVEPGQKTLERNVYRITGKGRDFFRKWLLDVPKEARLRVKDDFSTLFYFLGKLDTETEMELLEKQLASLKMQVHVYDRKVESQGDHDFYIRSIMKKGSLHLHAELEWLKEAIEDIKSRNRK